MSYWWKFGFVVPVPTPPKPCCAECATLESIIRLQDARINLLVDQLREAKREQT